MTNADIRQRVRERLDEQSATSSRYTDADIDQYTTDGIRFYTSLVGHQFSQFTITQQPQELVYTLPCEAIQVMRVEWSNGGIYYPLFATGLLDLDISWWRWQRQNDIRSRAYFIYGLNRIALWPTITSGTQSYIVHYKQDKFNDLSVVPTEDHEGLVNYCLARLLMVENKSQDGQKEYDTFKTICDKAKRRYADMGRVWAMSSRALR